MPSLPLLFLVSAISVEMLTSIGLLMLIKLGDLGVAGDGG